MELQSFVAIPNVAYLGAAILFILSLGGLSNQETARRGNTYGLVGMIIAISQRPSCSCWCPTRTARSVRSAGTTGPC